MLFLLLTKISKTTMRPVGTPGCETWAVKGGDKLLLCVFESNKLKRIFGPVKSDYDRAFK